MTTLDNLESALLASRKVSDFLKNFSPSQWTRILKATIVLGVQELERVAGTGDCQALNQLYPKDIEDIVVKNEEAIMRRRLEKANKDKQNGAKDKGPAAKEQQEKRKQMAKEGGRQVGQVK